MGERKGPEREFCYAIGLSSYLDDKGYDCKIDCNDDLIKGLLKCGKEDINDQRKMGLASIHAADVFYTLDGRDIGGKGIIGLTPNNGRFGDVTDFKYYQEDGFERYYSVKGANSSNKSNRISKETDYINSWTLGERSFDDKKLDTMLEKFCNQYSKETKFSETNEVHKHQLYHDVIMHLSKILPNKLHKTNFAKFFVGTKDFYKVSFARGCSSVKCFNTNGTLNWNTIKLPTKISGIYVYNYKPLIDSMLIACDNDWAFEFRVRSKDKFVRPGLGFEVIIRSAPAIVDVDKCKII